MRWAQRLFKRGRLEHDLAKELAYHVERRTAELVAEGVDPREAARRVRLEFGGADEIKEACRDARGTRWVEDFLLDCRYALRTKASNAFAVAVDGQGRITIDRDLRSFAGIEPGSPVVVSGAFDRVEVWHPESFERINTAGGLALKGSA